MTQNDELTKTDVNPQTFIRGSAGKQFKLIKVVETMTAAGKEQRQEVRQET